ncbi:hypothetical protein AB9E34_01415 [Rhizobium leguminosarum]|uniref:hypothetical protein n=1 Tax=Rhizobium leguminosarum TaxID=384 RepID=UPI003F9AB54A
MISRRLSLPGNFVEAFLYFDFLWLVSAEGDIWAFDIGRFIEAKFFDPAIAQHCTTAFARNDQLANPFAEFDPAYVPEVIEVTHGELEQFSRIFDTRLNFRSMLDMRCYYGRVFLASDNNIRQLNALSRSDLSHVALGRRANGQMGGDVVHDARCVQFRCQYGMISAACAYDGGFYAVGASSKDPSWKARFAQFSHHSMATEFVADRLTNVPEADSIEFYRTDYHHAQPQQAGLNEDLVEDDFEQYEITRVEEQDAQFSERTNEAVLGTNHAYAGKISRVFLSKSALFAVDYDHVIRSIKLLDGQEIAHQPSGSKPFPAAKGPIIAMTSSAVGMVAELDDEVTVLAEGKWHPVFDEAVYSIRGYPSSKWYRNLVTAVGADRTDLIFLKR